MSIIATLDAIQSLLVAAIPSRPPYGFAYLATVDNAGIARVRTMTLRGYDSTAGTIWSTSHIDSQKVQHLKQHPDAELCLWLAEQGAQLRLQATWLLVDTANMNLEFQKLRQRTWDQQPPESRALYSQSAPGTVPTPFTVLLGTITTIDALHISPTAFAHYRHQRAGDGWQSQKLAR